MNGKEIRKVFKEKPSNLFFLFGLVVFLMFCLVDLKAIYWAALDWITLRSSLNILSILIFISMNISALLITIFTLFRLSRLRLFLSKIRVSLWIKWFIVSVIGMMPVLVFLFSAWGNIFTSYVLRFWFFGSTLLLMTLIAGINQQKFFHFSNLFTSAIILCSIFLLGNKLKEVVNYPFMLYWSEGNRFWDYSVLFAREKYIYPNDKPIPVFLELGRQTLWGLPFLVKNPSIALLRLWNVILFSIPYMLLGGLFFYKKNINFFVLLLCGFWTFLFLSQGPIYTPLVLAALLVILATRTPFLISILIVGGAGYYANLSRYSWSAAPAIWIVLLSVFIYPFQIQRKNRIDWRRTIILGVAGLAGGLILPSLSTITNLSVSTSDHPYFLSAARTTLESQTLIWSRLFPNPTFNLGILLALILAVLPIYILIGCFKKQSGFELNLWQKLALAGSSLFFLIVGLIASIKIGGGSNLHNLDMFLINSLFLVGLAWAHNAEKWLLNFTRHPFWIKGLLIFMVLYPVIQIAALGQPLNLPPEDEQKNVLKIIQKSVDEAKNTGEVLFIDQRQLLTFGYIKNVTLVTDYEKKYLMNEAMGNNQELFNQFYRDLKKHRFSLIINEPVFIDYQAEDYTFGAENDAWVRWVSEPLLCYYRPLYTFKHEGVELLIPRIAPLQNTRCP